VDEIISQVTTGVSGGIKVDVMTVLTAMVSILLIICGGRLLYEIIIRSSQNSEESKGIFTKEESEEER
jgi:hypothetical protein